MIDNGSSRIVILQRAGTSDLREGIGILEKAPSSRRTGLTVPRQGGIEAKERHCFSLDDGRGEEQVGVEVEVWYQVWWGKRKARKFNIAA